MITVTNLNKSYGDNQVLNDLSIAIPSQETIALLGTNGAGKSTLIKILSGLLPYNNGDINIDGQDYNSFLSSNTNKSKIGVVPQEMALYETLTVRQNLNFWAKLYGLPKQKVNEKITHYLQLLDLEHLKNKKLNTLSIGQQKIVSLLCGIIHDPSILFLDEPTVGIDILHKEKIYAFINDLKTRGITIIYTTHNFSEIPKICDKIAILKDGKINDFGTEQTLIAKYKLNQSIDIQIESDLLVGSLPLGSFKEKGVDVNLKKDRVLSIKGKQPSLVLPDILRTLFDNKIRVDHLKINQPSLENIFIQAHN